MTMHEAIRPSRRGLLKGAAGAVLLGFHLPSRQALAQGLPAAGSQPELNAWVVIHPDGRVVLRMAKTEMGQGVRTGLAQMFAEEMHCDWSKLSTEYVTPGQSLARNRVWGNFLTAGSQGIRSSQEIVRKGGAAARMMLTEAAAARWGVPAAECSAKDSVITHAGSGRTLRYAEVVTEASRLTPPSDVPLKDPAQWAVIGKPLPRLDTADKTTGKLVYGQDLRMPGMLIAVPKRCPVFGGTVQSFDAAAVSGMPGVRHVLKVGDAAVAVVADTFWQAKTALDALPVEWDTGENGRVSSETISAMLDEGLTAPEAFIGNQQGDARAAIAGAARRVEATYSYPYQNHAPMEPMNATVVWTAERCDVWCPTQNGEAALAAASQAAGLPQTACDIHRVDLGGGFGRRTVHDWLADAILIARQVPGTPVKTMWTREEDMVQGRYHPVTKCRLVAGLDAENRIVGLHMRISGQSILSTAFPGGLQNGRDPVQFQGLNAGGAEGAIGYTFPNLLIDHAMRNPHVPAHFWRGVNHNQNAIYLECFLDEVAHATNQDPLALRRSLMANHPKHLAVLNAVAERIGWDKPAPAGIHRGIAQQMGFGSYVAAAAEVSVSDKGQLRVHRIVAATDCGHAVNPRQIEMQVEGSFVYGLSAMLYGACTVKDGAIEQTNFDTYNVMRIDEMPEVETIVMPSGGFWGGVGEPTIMVAAPAVLNAVFAGTGRRIRNMPLGDQLRQRT
ncbi:xanthine dehydrogenase family protein molybdopterin-binding subunit [Pseudoroseomonas wenyumeiae]|uniref:Xanthine dehydrogenase family protein molybdopterin-binding subunit n=1 Tax=Teichococcus wenyumeiae TaxID=2478470 RepID=A0A3A9JK73_9PROT|nr:molybdopterin cofactor-binding domain-containing protein [Pseudoroseomonas wenyumeiae]RKK05183.1 xanthine dehydrogenase family protein molybdopterin-binding subunit [Pseudoroseomonas wenyumeiae]RMI17568.1 xanthine dehydrogenase family protein molybdopterin-binding subunit [Pseudoroseomonas wenyumeiae]